MKHSRSPLTANAEEVVQHSLACTTTTIQAATHSHNIQRVDVTKAQFDNDTHTASAATMVEEG